MLHSVRHVLRAAGTSLCGNICGKMNELDHDAWSLSFRLSVFPLTKELSLLLQISVLVTSSVLG